MSDGTTVTIVAANDELELTDTDLDHVIEALVDYGAAISTEVGRVSVTMSIDQPIGSAIDEARRIFGEVIEWADGEIVRIDARTHDEHDAELAQPIVPELIGVAELAALLKVSPQRASELQARSGFPVPIAKLKSGPIWVRSNVEHFARNWKRKPGRPRKQTSMGVIVGQPSKVDAGITTRVDDKPAKKSRSTAKQRAKG